MSDDLADRLRETHRRIATAGFSDDESSSLTRRLIALSDVAKVDAERAARRLDRLLADLEGSQQRVAGTS